MPLPAVRSPRHHAKASTLKGRALAQADWRQFEHKSVVETKNRQQQPAAQAAFSDDLPGPVPPLRLGAASAVTAVTVEHAEHAARAAQRLAEDQTEQDRGTISLAQLRSFANECVQASKPGQQRPSPRTLETITSTASQLSGALACQSLLQGKMSADAFAESVRRMPPEALHAWMVSFGSCLARLGGTLMALRRQRDSAMECNNRTLLQQRLLQTRQHVSDLARQVACAVLCYAMLRYAMLCCAMLCHATPCYAMPCDAIARQVAMARQGALQQLEAGAAHCDELLQAAARHSRIASHRVASHRIASHRIASHRIANAAAGGGAAVPGAATHPLPLGTRRRERRALAIR